jgi:hypothetical protein
MLQDHLPFFDIDIAFFSLQMSAIIYERLTDSLDYSHHRNADLLGFASDLYDSVIIKMIRQGKPIPKDPFLGRGPRNEALRYTIVKCLFGADRKIVKQAKDWGLNFMAVSDLNGRKVHPSTSAIRVISGTLRRIILERKVIRTIYCCRFQRDNSG